MNCQLLLAWIIVISLVGLATSIAWLLTARASSRREQHMADQLLKLGAELQDLREFRNKIIEWWAKCS